MTVALLLAAAPDRLSAMAQPIRRPGDRMPGARPRIDGLDGRLAAAGVRQIEVAMCADAADGLRAVAATARTADDAVLVCAASRPAPTAALAALLSGSGTAALTGTGTLLVARDDLPAVADAADALATRIGSPSSPGAGRGRRLTVRPLRRRKRVGGELNNAVRSLIDAMDGRVRVASLATPATGPGEQSTPGGQAETGLLAVAVAPVAATLARLAAACSLTPNALTGIALALSGCAAAWFAAGRSTDAAAGAGLLCAALVLRQARIPLAARRQRPGPGLLPRSRPSSRPAPAGRRQRTDAAAYGSWLASIADMLAEYGVYAGLAAGWVAGRPRQAWVLATAAVIVLALRQTAGSGQGRPGRAGGGHRLSRLAGQSIALPPAERAALICVTAPVWGPRIALFVLLGWGVVALGYSLAERVVAGRQPESLDVAACRDDGPLASRVGQAVRGQLMPLLPVVAGIMVTGMLAALGLRNLPGPLILAPAVAMLLAALGAGHPHDGRLDWLVLPLLQAGQYVYLATVGFATAVPGPVTFALIASIALHHADVQYWQRQGISPSPELTAAGLGWEGRMLVAGAGAVLGIESLVYVALAAYLWVLFGRDSLAEARTAAQTREDPA